MASGLLTVFFLVPACNAIFFGGGGCGGCNSGCGCQPPPPPPPCACAAPPPPPRPCYATPPRYPVGPVAPPPLPVSVAPSAYSLAAVPIPTPLQEKVAASNYPVEPVPIDKPVAPKYDTAGSYVTDSIKPPSFKSKADADDYEILSSSGYRRKPQKKRTAERDSKCNNRQLRIIIHKSIDQSLSASQAKISIGAAAKEIFGYNFDVICAEKPFTFSVSSELYCELSVGDTFCLAFKH